MTETLFNMVEELQEKAAKVLKVLGDPNRIKIVELLRDGEMCQCDIIPLIGQSQPTVSRHLSLLEENGVLISRKDGVRMLYQISDPKVLEIIDHATSLI
jgi:DNA-binding transcriptional ArsR family regulator